MIYRYHLYDKPVPRVRQETSHYKIALQSVLTRFPEQLENLLDGETEAHNEIMMKDDQEAYLKITTSEGEARVDFAMQAVLRLSGLKGTRLA